VPLLADKQKDAQLPHQHQQQQQHAPEGSPGSRTIRARPRRNNSYKAMGAAGRGWPVAGGYPHLGEVTRGTYACVGAQGPGAGRGEGGQG
jgi:hypothetical protein